MSITTQSDVLLHPTYSSISGILHMLERLSGSAPAKSHDVGSRGIHSPLPPSRPAGRFSTHPSLRLSLPSLPESQALPLPPLAGDGTHARGPPASTRLSRSLRATDRQVSARVPRLPPRDHGAGGYPPGSESSPTPHSMTHLTSHLPTVSRGFGPAGPRRDLATPAPHRLRRATRGPLSTAFLVPPPSPVDTLTQLSEVDAPGTLSLPAPPRPVPLGRAYSIPIARRRWLAA